MLRLSYLARLLGWAAFVVIPLLLVVVIAWKLLVVVVVVTTRYVIGAPMLGHSSTDATFWSDGTRRVHKPLPWEFGEPTRWSLMAWRRRAGWRLVVPTVVAAVVYAWLRWPTITEWSAVVVAAVVVGIKEWRGLHWWRLRDHLNHYVKPLHAALAPRLELDPEVVRPRDWLHIPRNFADAEADPCIRIDLPETFYAGSNEDEEESGGGLRRAEPGLKRLVDDQVFAKLELNRAEMTTTYHMAGPRPVVEYRHLPAVPDLVSVDMVGRELAKANPSTVVFGMGKGGRVVKFDLDVDNPHVLLSMPTNGGKSWTIRAAITPLLPKEQDVRVVVIDPKHVSQVIYRDHPHVRIVRHISDIHDEFVFLGREVDRRNQAIWNGDDPGPRIIVVIEEANSLADLLAEHWQANKPSGHNGPCPSVAGMRRIPFMGREARMHQFLVSQEGNMRATGGGGARTNYGHAFLGRGSQKSAWRMVAPDMKQPPRKESKRGRMYYVGGSSPEELQVVAWTDEETREYAFRGFAPEEFVSGSQCDRESFYQGKHHVTVTAEPETVSTVGTHESVNTGTQETANTGSYETEKPLSKESGGRRLVVVDGNASAEIQEAPESAEAAAAKWAEEVVPEEPYGEPADDEEPVTLREAIEQGIVYANRLELRNPLDSLRRIANSKRGQPRYDPTFPTPVGARGQAKTYRPSQLRFWERNSAPGAGSRQSKGGA